VAALFFVAVAVTLIKPTVVSEVEAVTSPPLDIVAADIPVDPGAIVQETGVVPVLLSLNVAVTLIWTVLPPDVPDTTVGVAGTTVIAVGVGLTKNPVQLTANASVASAAKAPINRSLDFVEDMVLRDSLGAPLDSYLYFLAVRLQKL